MVVELLESKLRSTQPADWLADRRIFPSDESSELTALLSLVERLQREVSRLDAERDQLREESQRLRAQVEDAARVQRELLPQTAQFAGLDIRRLYKPVDGVAGDMLSAERIDDGTLAISLADVSGHGVAAGMLTPLLRRALSVRAADAKGDTPSPEDVLARANRELLALELAEGQFATALHARYESTTRQLSFARAGHPHLILLRDGEAPQLLTSDGTLLGALPDLTFPTRNLTLQAGDRVVFYTDGLEALIADDTYGAHPTALADTAWFAGLAELSADAIIADVEQRLTRASWRSADADDVTVVVLTAR
ncbi:MAG: SpoIIE family protein phosphatase [Phycisphaerales bacterium]|nr:SpoIIE family protein phosphatase [Phycisphaerales bacterium]